MQTSWKQSIDILSADATELAKLIQKRELTSVQCVKTFIEQIKTVNPQLNAVVEERFNEALEEAAIKDAQINQINIEAFPLYGVPISIKESIHVKGMKTTGALSHRHDIVMVEDAEVVKKVKEAGAIILCKTNTPSLCFCQETDNKLYGRTNNAWHIERTAGGSSGGEAALVATGGSPIGLGSDIGGSIRFPSHFNGVIGFKPGNNQVNTKGHFPPDDHPLKKRMSSIDPIGKSVRDIKLAYKIIADKNHSVKAFYEKMNIEILPTDIELPLSEESKSLLNDVYIFLQDNYHMEKTIPPHFNDSTIIWQEIMSINGAKEMKQLAFNTDRPHVWKHYMKEKITGKTDIHQYLSWALIGANMFKPSQKRVREIESFLHEGDFVLDQYLNNRLLIFPVYHTTAPLHGQLFKEVFSIQKTYQQYLPFIAYANVWGLPSLTLPIGQDDYGMPIAIQIIGKNGNEHAIFHLGQQLEGQFRGFIRSNLYDA